jgi:hypothetical protein
VPCPSVPSGYVAPQGAVDAAGYDYGIYRFDSRVDPSTCDAATLPVARMARLTVLRWWVMACEFDARSIGTVVRFDGFRHVGLTHALYKQGCDGLEEARRILASESS